MTASNRLNLWMAATTAERDGLGSEDGVAVGDFCLVDGVNLYVASAVAMSTSTWRPIAGLPTIGRYGLSGRTMHAAGNNVTFQHAAFTFRALLDAAPSSITLTATSTSNWSTLPIVFILDQYGFSAIQASNSVPTNTNCWNHGRYQINY